MQILSEQERVVVDMECEWEDRELELLIDYAEKNMPEEVRKSMLLSWAFEDILRKHLAELEEGTTDEDALERLGVDGEQA